MKKIGIVLTSVGILLLILSIYLAIFVEYNHFYEFMLIGLFLILYPLTKKYFDKQIFITLYLIFLVAGGLIGDLLFGITIGELWYYNYSSLIEYFFLYMLIYPLGGLVMIMSFLFFTRNYKLKTKATSIFQTKLLGFLSLLCVIAFFLFILLKYYYKITYSGFFVASFGWLFFLIYFNYLAEKRKISSYFTILLANPKKVILATLLGTYFNAFLHEYPNLFAKQWVYQNFIFQDSQLFGIPIAVVSIGWLALMIFSVSVYYLVRKYSSLTSF